MQMPIENQWNTGASSTDSFFGQTEASNRHSFVSVELENVSSDVAKINEMGVQLVSIATDVATKYVAPALDWLVGKPIEVFMRPVRVFAEASEDAAVLSMTDYDDGSSDDEDESGDEFCECEDCDIDPTHGVSRPTSHRNAVLLRATRKRDGKVTLRRKTEPDSFCVKGYMMFLVILFTMFFTTTATDRDEPSRLESVNKIVSNLETRATPSAPPQTASDIKWKRHHPQMFDAITNAELFVAKKTTVPLSTNDMKWRHHHPRMFSDYTNDELLAAYKVELEDAELVLPVVVLADPIKVVKPVSIYNQSAPIPHNCDDEHSHLIQACAAMRAFIGQLTKLLVEQYHSGDLFSTLTSLLVLFVASMLLCWGSFLCLGYYGCYLYALAFLLFLCGKSHCFVWFRAPYVIMCVIATLLHHSKAPNFVQKPFAVTVQAFIVHAYWLERHCLSCELSNDCFCMYHLLVFLVVGVAIIIAFDKCVFNFLTLRRFIKGKPQDDVIQKAIKVLQSVAKPEAGTGHNYTKKGTDRTVVKKRHPTKVYTCSADYDNEDILDKKWDVEEEEQRRLELAQELQDQRYGDFDGYLASAIRDDWGNDAMDDDMFRDMDKEHLQDEIDLLRLMDDDSTGGRTINALLAAMPESLFSWKTNKHSKLHPVYQRFKALPENSKQIVIDGLKAAADIGPMHVTEAEFSSFYRRNKIIIFQFCLSQRLSCPKTDPYSPLISSKKSKADVELRLRNKNGSSVTLSTWFDFYNYVHINYMRKTEFVPKVVSTDTPLPTDPETTICGSVSDPHYATGGLVYKSKDAQSDPPLTDDKLQELCAKTHFTPKAAPECASTPDVPVTKDPGSLQMQEAVARKNQLAEDLNVLFVQLSKMGLEMKERKKEVNTLVEQEKKKKSPAKGKETAPVQPESEVKTPGAEALEKVAAKKLKKAAARAKTQANKREAKAVAAKAALCAPNTTVPKPESCTNGSKPAANGYTYVVVGEALEQLRTITMTCLLREVIKIKGGNKGTTHVLCLTTVGHDLDNTYRAGLNEICVIGCKARMTGPAFVHHELKDFLLHGTNLVGGCTYLFVPVKFDDEDTETQVRSTVMHTTPFASGNTTVFWNNVGRMAAIEEYINTSQVRNLQNHGYAVFMNDISRLEGLEYVGEGTSGAGYVQGRRNEVSLVHWGSMSGNKGNLAVPVGKLDFKGYKKLIRAFLTESSHGSIDEIATPQNGSGSVYPKTIVDECVPEKSSDYLERVAEATQRDMNDLSKLWALRAEIGRQHGHGNSKTRQETYAEKPKVNVNEHFSDKRTHVLTRGCNSHMEEQLTNGVCSDPHPCESDPIFDEVMDYMEAEIIAVLDGVDTTPMDPLDAILAKKEDSATGLPWANSLGTFGDVITLLKASGSHEDELVNYLNEYEQVIINDPELVTHFSGVFPKSDCYVEAKIEDERYRTIQTFDFMTTALIRKYMGPIEGTLKEELPYVYLKTTEEQHAKKVLARMMALYTLGIDFSKFDKRHSRTILRRVILILFGRTQMPTKVAEFLAEAITHGYYTLPNGKIIQLNGTNPSGVYLTSLNNEFVHRIMSLFLFTKILDCKVADVDKRVVSVYTADDGIDGFHTLADCNKVASEIIEAGQRWFRIKIKLACYNGDASSPAHPPGILPSYLSVVLVERCGTFVTVPSDFRKRLCKLQFNAGSSNTHEQAENQWLTRAMGILASAMGFLALQKLDPSYRPPASFLVLHEHLLANKAKVAAAGLGTVPTVASIKFGSFPTPESSVCDVAY